VSADKELRLPVGKGFHGVGVPHFFKEILTHVFEVGVLGGN
jgi:hypothetical protein